MQKVLAISRVVKNNHRAQQDGALAMLEIDCKFIADYKNLCKFIAKSIERTEVSSQDGIHH